mgnify:CR=1 FL=1|tara:strand:+ start:1476 stop:1730 length:255 start_codon:yes stop_codon:yes gene_type:complete
MTKSNRQFETNRVWLEIKPKVDTPEGWQEAVELVNNMLNRLSDSDEQGKTFGYANGELHYYHGGGYSVQTDNGCWFNLDYLGRK